MLFDYLLKKDYARLESLQQTRRWNRLLITKEQADLKREVLRELGTGKGMLLSFTAGCATGVTASQRDRLSILKRLSISQIAAFASLLK